MKLYYDECEISGNIMADFARFEKVSDYLLAYLAAYESPNSDAINEFQFNPLEVDFRDVKTGNRISIISSGRVVATEAEIHRLKRLPVVYDNFISDKLIIKADGFERELFFDWE